MYYDDEEDNFYHPQNCIECGCDEEECSVGTPNGPMCGDCYRELQARRKAAREAANDKPASK